MNEQDAWKAFSQTGSIQDYLYYRSVKNSQVQENEKANEDTNRRSDSKTTEYR
ncbi:MAG: YqzL family protein [Ruminococcus sp.]|nr:YqzL family protein [Ruminococcus sp.]